MKIKQNLVYVLFFVFLTTTLPSQTLDEVIQYALKNAPISKQAKLDEEMMQQKQKANKANLFGDVDMVGSYTYYNTARTLIPLTPTVLQSGEHVMTTQDILSIGVSYNVALFTGFAQTRQVEIDNISKTISSIRTKLTNEELVYNIRSLYLSILALKDMLKAQDEYIKNLQELKDRIAYEVQLGKKAKIDLIKAEVDIADASTEKNIIKSNIEKTFATLQELVGKDISTIEPITIDMDTKNESLDTQIQTLKRVELEELSIDKSQKSIQKASASYIPQVALASYYGKNYGIDDTFNEQQHETIWQVGVNAKWNIFNFGKTTATVELAKISKLKAKVKKEQTVLELEKLKTHAQSEIELNFSKYKTNQKQLLLAKESAKIEQVRYDNDASTLNDLLLAKSKEKLILSKLIQSKYDYQKSRFYLDYLLEKGVEGE